LAGKSIAAVISEALISPCGEWATSDSQPGLQGGQHENRAKRENQYGSSVAERIAADSKRMTDGRDEQPNNHE
jgi:hypothetical protein